MRPYWVNDVTSIHIPRSQLIWPVACYHVIAFRRPHFSLNLSLSLLVTRLGNCHVIAMRPYWVNDVNSIHILRPQLIEPVACYHVMASRGPHFNPNLSS